MNFELTQEQRAFCEAARDFAAKEFAPHAAHWDQEAIFPREAIALAGDQGFCGMYAAVEAGGLGLPRLDTAMVFEELAAVDPSTTAYISIHNMATWMLSRWGHASHRRALGRGALQRHQARLLLPNGARSRI